MTSPRHVLRSNQFTREQLEKLFEVANGMRAIRTNRKHTHHAYLSGFSAAHLFFQPSTRTDCSFSQAFQLLGGTSRIIVDPSNLSSFAKGETMADSVKVYGALSFDAIVMRHPDLGMVEEAARHSEIPILNAGDGTGQHPSQALLDCYTIYKECGRIDGLTVAICGDLEHARTAHSLAYLLAKFKIKKLYLVSPANCRMKEGIRAYLQRHGVDFEEADDIKKVASEVDVFYLLRLQKEYWTDLKELEDARHKTNFGPEVLARCKPSARILHPLPRVDELDPACDGDPRIVIFKQVTYGVEVRMALWLSVLCPDKKMGTDGIVDPYNFEESAEE